MGESGTEGSSFFLQGFVVFDFLETMHCVTLMEKNNLVGGRKLAHGSVKS